MSFYTWNDRLRIDNPKNNALYPDFFMLMGVKNYGAYTTRMTIHSKLVYIDLMRLSAKFFGYAIRLM